MSEKGYKVTESFKLLQLSENTSKMSEKGQLLHKSTTIKTMQQNLGYNSGLQRSLISQIQQRTEESVRVHRRLFFKCLVN